MNEFGIRWSASGQITAQESRAHAVEIIKSWRDKEGIVNSLMVRSGPDAEWQPALGGSV